MPLISFKFHRIIFSIYCMSYVLLTDARGNQAPMVEYIGGTYFIVIIRHDHVVAAVDSAEVSEEDKPINYGCKIEPLGKSAFFVHGGFSAFGTPTRGDNYITTTNKITDLARQAYSLKYPDLKAVGEAFMYSSMNFVQGFAGRSDLDKFTVRAVFASALPDTSLGTVYIDTRFENGQLKSNYKIINPDNTLRTGTAPEIYAEMRDLSTQRARDLSSALSDKLPHSSELEKDALSATATVQAMINWSGKSTIGGQIATIILEKGHPLRWYQHPSFCPEIQ